MVAFTFSFGSCLLHLPILLGAGDTIFLTKFQIEVEATFEEERSGGYVWEDKFFGVIGKNLSEDVSFGIRLELLT